MPFGLPARDEANWDTKLNDSINAVKATADAAQPSATLDAGVTAVDANSASEFRVQQDARQAAPKWAASQAVVVGTVRQAPDGSWIKSTAARTTGAAFDATEQTFWTAVAATAGTIEQAALSATYARGLSVKNPRFAAVGNGVADDTAAIQACVTAAATEGTVVYFPPGTYLVTAPIAYDNRHRFQGASLAFTKIKYSGAANTFAFAHTFTGDGSAQWPGRVAFADLTIEGNGTGALGVGATVGGIKCSDSTGTLVNIPYYSLSRVRMLRLKTAFELEGYGHNFTDCEAYDCLIGYDLTHPEQTMLINSWANYCDVGVSVNVRKTGHFGHMMHVIGGAYQRCRVGIRAFNFLELVIDTYFELNTEADIVLGDPADTTYASSVKSARIAGNFFSVPSTANIALYSTVGADIDFSRIGGSAVTVPQVLANTYSKYINVQYHPESVVSATTPWDFQTDSAKTSIARIKGGVEKAKLPTGLPADHTSSATAPVRYYKTDAETVVIEGSIDIGAAPGAGALFTLPVGHRPARQQTFNIVVYAGGWNWGTIEVRTDGTVVYQTPGASRSIFFGGISFRTGLG